MMQAYSWTIYQKEGVAEKIVDLSLMLDGVTKISKMIRPFFHIDYAKAFSQQQEVQTPKEVRIRLYKNEVDFQKQMLESSFLGTFEISFPDIRYR